MTKMDKYHYKFRMKMFYVKRYCKFMFCQLNMILRYNTPTSVQISQVCPDTGVIKDNALRVLFAKGSLKDMSSKISRINSAPFSFTRSISADLMFHTKMPFDNVEFASTSRLRKRLCALILIVQVNYNCWHYLNLLIQN